MYLSKILFCCLLGASSLAHASTTECGTGDDMMDEWLSDLLAASEEGCDEGAEAASPNPHVDNEQATESEESTCEESTCEEEGLSPEEKATLATIRYAEGADYDRLFGWFEDKSRVFDPYTQVGHPNSPYTSSGGTYTSTAAGAYQAMPATWAEEVARGSISNDFTPENQDRFALARLRYRGLLDEVQAGNTSWIDSRQMGREWASFPNSPYGQPIRSSADLRTYYYSKLREYRPTN